MISKALILNSLKTNFLGRELECLENIDSTNLEIWRRLKQTNLNEGFTLFAINQTEGKGRRGNKWIA